MRLIALAIALAAATAARAGDVNEKIDLWARGTTQLRGANIWQKARFKAAARPDWPGPFDRMETTYSCDNLIKFRTWNANVANLSHPATYHQRPADGRYALLPEVRYHLRQLVEKFRERQMFVVISFRTGPGRTERVFSDTDDSDLLADLFDLTPAGRPTARATAAQAAWVEMWRDTAEYFKDQPNVIGYHLLIEPVTQAERRVNGQPQPVPDPRLDPIRVALWYDFALRMAAAIREKDALTPILVGGAPYNAAETLAAFPVERFAAHKRVVVIVHQYEPSDFAESANGSYGDPERKALRAAYCAICRFADEHPTQPIAVGEFGCVRWAGTADKRDAPIYLREQFELLEVGGFNHALWLWEAENIDYSQFNFRFGVDPMNTKHDAPADEALVKLVRDNWARNRVFATPVVLNKFR
jgi:hypothetical protein